MIQEQIELIDYLRVIGKKKWLIGGGVLLCAGGALAISLLIPKVYQTSLQLQIGKVWGKSVEDPYRVSEIINSEPFIEKIREKLKIHETAYEMKEKKIVFARTIEARANGPETYPILLDITARGPSPEQVIRIADTVAEFIVQDHDERFNELINKYYLYENELQNQVKAIRKDISELDTLLTHNREKLNVEAPAVILLQAHLEQKQTQLLQFIRELRDVRLNNTSRVYTENSRVILPPVPPEEHVIPRTIPFVTGAGITGLIIFIFLAFFLEYIERVRLRERRKES